MHFALENVKNHAFLQKLFGKELGFQASPGTICMSGETQLGWPRWSAYPEVTLVWVVQSTGSLLGVFMMRESDLLDMVSGIMFFLPGMWWTVNLYLMDFSL